MCKGVPCIGSAICLTILLLVSNGPTQATSCNTAVYPTSSLLYSFLVQDTVAKGSLHWQGYGSGRYWHLEGLECAKGPREADRGRAWPFLVGSFSLGCITSRSWVWGLVATGIGRRLDAGGALRTIWALLLEGSVAAGTGYG